MQGSGRRLCRPYGPAAARARRFTSRFFLAVGLLAFPILQALAADPFYEQLLREGQRAYARADYVRAEENLRLACFGFLEEPSLLAECLVHLALAQAQQDKRDAFGRTFYRLAEVEQRFEGYSRAYLDPQVRAAFESWLVKWISLDTLERSPGFRRAAQAHVESRLLRLPPDERRPELESRVAEQSDNPRWRLLLADLELSENNGQAALELLLPLLRSDPSNGEARCLRGEARAQNGNCREALADLAACTNAGGDDRTARAVLSCHVALERWDEARSFLVTLSPELQKQREIQKLARTVEKARPREPDSEDGHPGSDTGAEGGSGAQATPGGGSAESRAPPAATEQRPRRTSNPGQSAAAERGANEPAATRLEKVEVLSGGSSPSFHIAGNGRFSYTTLSLKAPHRFVVDLDGVVFAASRSTVQVGGPVVRRVRMAQLEPAPDAVARVVFDLERVAAPRIERVVGGLVVHFGNARETLSAAEAQRLERARQLLRQARTAADLEEPLRLAREVADARPASQEAQLVAAEIAYRAARWQEAANYFRRAGDPGDDQPTLLFYQAVAYYETGDRQGAAAALRRCLPKLRRTDYVDSYVEKILGSSGS